MLQEEQRLLLEQEREKRIEFEIKQREKENQLLGKINMIIHYLLNIIYVCSCHSYNNKNKIDYCFRSTTEINRIGSRKTAT